MNKIEHFKVILITQLNRVVGEKLASGQKEIFLLAIFKDENTERDHELAPKLFRIIMPLENIPVRLADIADNLTNYIQAHAPENKIDIDDGDVEEFRYEFNRNPRVHGIRVKTNGMEELCLDLVCVACDG